MAHIIVVGNEKGGAGKSTVSMHLATALARMGHKVSGLDLDLRQRTFGRYVDNRLAFLKQTDLDLPSPTLTELPEVNPKALRPGENVYDHRLSAAVAGMEKGNDFILSKIANQNDFWMHILGVEGSSVIIKNPHNLKELPEVSKYEAANLALSHSKLKDSKKGQVILTHRKYVRKIKGTKGGVHYKNEEIVNI